MKAPRPWRSASSRCERREDALMADAVWVLGAAMTKIARYDDKDVVDLAAEATFDALDDAGVSIFDVQVLAAGSLFTQGGIGQMISKQIGQTGIPIYNVTN